MVLEKLWKFHLNPLCILLNPTKTEGKSNWVLDKYVAKKCCKLIFFCKTQKKLMSHKHLTIQFSTLLLWLLKKLFYWPSSFLSLLLLQYLCYNIFFYFLWFNIFWLFFGIFFFTNMMICFAIQFYLFFCNFISLRL